MRNIGVGKMGSRAVKIYSAGLQFDEHVPMETARVPTSPSSPNKSISIIHTSQNLRIIRAS
jgi:hypothetical protein